MTPHRQLEAAAFITWIACAAGSCVAPTRPAAQPTAPGPAVGEPAGLEEIIARAKAAAGGPAWDQVVRLGYRGTLRGAGLEGPFESVEDLTTCQRLETYRLGPLSIEEGFDGARSWSRDQTGTVNVQGSRTAQEAAATAAFRTCRALWFPARWPARMELAAPRSEGARRFQVIAIHPRGGRPFELWLDTGTWLVDRLVEPGELDTETTFFSDYRPTGGLVLPYAWRTSNGQEKYDRSAEVEACIPDPAPPTHGYSAPKETVADFTIEGSSDRAQVPFELYNNHIYIQARLDGRGPHRFLLDTGGINVLTPPTAQALGVKVEGALQGRGAGPGSEDVGLAKVGQVAVGPVQIHEQVFYVVGIDKLSAVEGLPIEGLLGYEVFKRFTVQIDYADRTLTLLRPGALDPREAGTPVPFVFDEHNPQVEGRIDGIPGVFSIDTGSRLALTLLGPFVLEHALVNKYRAPVEAMTGWGVGGPMRGHVARAGLLELGSVPIPGPVIDLFSGTAGAFSRKNVAGNVGGGVLKRFTVTFDYAAQILYLKPNRTFHEAGSWDKAGLWLNLDGSVFQVMDVIAGSPADRAGLRVGDRVLAVDGVPAKDLLLPAVREKLRESPAGTRVTLTLRTDHGPKEIALTLADLIGPSSIRRP